MRRTTVVYWLQQAVIGSLIFLSVVVMLVVLSGGCALVEKPEADLDFDAAFAAYMEKQEASSDAGSGSGWALTGGQGDSIALWLAIAALGLMPVMMVATIVTYVTIVKPWAKGRLALKNGGGKA